MPIKTIVKIGILFITIFIIIVGGFVMFKRLKYNKEVLNIDLHSYIPAQTNSVLQINKQKDIILFSNYIEILDTIFKGINDTDLTYPLYVINDTQNTTLLVRVTTGQEIVLKEHLERLFSDFLPKKRVYKNVDILFYPTSNNSFYCTMFYNGIFACGYNYKQLEQIIDTKESNSFFNKSAIKRVKSKINNLYSANFYSTNNDSAILFNILANKLDLKFEGYTDYISHQSSDSTDSKSLTKKPINYKIFPNEPVAFDIINTTHGLISDSIDQLFDYPNYIFYLKNNTEKPVYILKHKDDKFRIYNLLNDLEFKFTKNKFNINDFVNNKQRVYTASLKLSENIFNKESIVTFTFYNDYLVYSESRNALIQYLKSNGNYSKPDSTLLDNIKPDDEENIITKYFYKEQLKNLTNIYNIEKIFNRENLYLYGNVAQQNDDVQINIILTK